MQDAIRRETLSNKMQMQINTNYISTPCTYYITIFVTESTHLYFSLPETGKMKNKHVLCSTEKGNYFHQNFLFKIGCELIQFYYCHGILAGHCRKVHLLLTDKTL